MAAFKVDAAVRMAGQDCAGLERLFRHCARPSNVWSAEHCCRWQPNEGCLLLAVCCLSMLETFKVSGVANCCTDDRRSLQDWPRIARRRSSLDAADVGGGRQIVAT